MNDHVINGGRPFSAILEQISDEGFVVRISTKKGSAIEGGDGQIATDEAIGPANSPQAMLARYATQVDLGTTKNDDLVLDQYSKGSFDRLENRIRQQPKLYKTLAFASRGGTQPGISAMFQAPAGHGKALAARVMAVRLNKPLYTPDMDKILGDTPAQT